MFVCSFLCSFFVRLTPLFVPLFVPFEWERVTQFNRRAGVLRMKVMRRVLGINYDRVRKNKKQMRTADEEYKNLLRQRLELNILDLRQSQADATSILGIA